jgi:hypothetical protein
MSRTGQSFAEVKKKKGELDRTKKKKKRKKRDQKTGFRKIN